MPKKNVTFEDQMKRLEEIVNTLDDAEKPLEELLQHYEEGMKLTNSLRNFLNNAELKIIQIEKEVNDQKAKDQ
jgi:exodeoxyribonuclease VII small subunit